MATQRTSSPLMELSVNELEEFLRGRARNNLDTLAEAAGERSRAGTAKPPIFTQQYPFLTEPPLLAESSFRAAEPPFCSAPLFMTPMTTQLSTVGRSALCGERAHKNSRPKSQ